MLTIFLRSVILYAASLLAMRAMGKRQVGQLQPFELVVVIMIAELAATPMGGGGHSDSLRACCRWRRSSCAMGC